jgi:hypothetical protein
VSVTLPVNLLPSQVSSSVSASVAVEVQKLGQNHAEIDTIPYLQKCRKSAVSGRFFYFRHCGGIGRTVSLPGRITLFGGTL